MLDLSDLAAPTLLGVLLLTPLIALTVLTLLTALVVLFDTKRRGDRAHELFDASLNALLWLLSAVLRCGGPPQKRRRRRSGRGRR
ncbi:hypothetical protein ACWCW7_33795 [Nocardia tengchongensis]